MLWRSATTILLVVCLLFPIASHAQDYAIRPKFESVGHFHDGLAPAMQNGRWGFINVAGDWVIKPRFDAVKAGSDRRFGIKERDLWGYINSAGQLVIPFRYKEASQFSDGMAAVSENDETFYIIDIEGRNTTSDQWFRYVSPMRGGLATVQTDFGEWTGLRRGSAYAAPSPYLQKASSDFRFAARADIEELTPLSEGHAFMLHQGSYRLVRYNEYNTSTSFTMPDGTRRIDRFPAFKSVRRFSDGLAAVSPDGVLWGFIDRNARYVIAPEFEAAREFTQGVAPVRINGLWGYIDRQGTVVFPPSFDRSYSFREGYATTRQGDLRGFLQIGSDGQISNLYPPQFEDVFSFREGLAPVKTGGLWGFIKAPGVEPRVLTPIRQESGLRSLRP